MIINVATPKEKTQQRLHMRFGMWKYLLMNLSRGFWSTLGFLLTLFGIFWLPKDIEDWSQAAAPWKRVLSMLDQNAALWIFAVASLVYIAWIDLRPFLRRRLGSPIKIVQIGTIRAEMLDGSKQSSPFITVANNTTKTMETFQAQFFRYQTGKKDGTDYILSVSKDKHHVRNMNPDEEVRYVIASGVRNLDCSTITIISDINGASKLRNMQEIVGEVKFSWRNGLPHSRFLEMRWSDSGFLEVKEINPL